MDTKAFKYRSTFVCQASVHAPSEDELKVAKASLDGLRQLLPADIDPEADPDLLYISGDGALGGVVNRNRDGITKETAVAIHKSSRNKFINAEHSRDSILGVVLYPALTRIGSHEILTDEQALASSEPFNMSFAGVLWKVVSPMISQYIAKQGDSTDKTVLSLSWEIAFSRYAVLVGGDEIAKGRLIPMEDPSFAIYDKMLVQNGGKGVDAKGTNVSRVFEGDAIILGFGIVSQPAAHVKGILPIEKLPEPTATINASIEISDTQIDAIVERLQKKMQDSETAQKAAARTVSPLKTAPEPVMEIAAYVAAVEKSDEKNRNVPNASVTLNTPMKIETVEQLTANWEEIRKNESVASVVDFVKAIKEGSDKYMADLKAQEDLLKNAELAKAANEKRASELQASLDTIKKELAEVRAAQEAAVSNQKFQERMASFDEKFDLDDEDRALLTKDIKDLDDDAFAAYAAKCDKLMAAKSKKAKPFEKKDDKKKTDEECAAEKAAADAAALAAKEEAIKAAVASIKEVGGQVTLPNGVAVDQDVAQQMATAFGGSLKINGQTVEERKAARAKAKK